MKTTIIGVQSLLIIALLSSLLLCVNANAQNSATVTTLETIQANGFDQVSIDNANTVVKETKGSRIIVERTVTIRGTFNNSEAVLSHLKAKGAFSSTSLDNDGTIRTVRPEKIYLNNGQTIEVFESFVISVPANIAVKRL